MKAEIEFKDVTHFKLTIAKNRVSIKIPKNSPIEGRAEIINFFHKIIEEIGVPEHTLRGKYRDGVVIMNYDSKKIFKTFKNV